MTSSRKEARMGTTAESLYERVDELIQSHKREPLLSTTGTRAAIGELMSRLVGLEEAIHEIALEIQRREDSKEGLSADAGSAAAGRLSTSPIKRGTRRCSRVWGYVNLSVTLRRRIRGSGRRGDRVGGPLRWGVG